MQQQKPTILAFAAHPDDVELSGSGTLALHKKRGYKVGIIDLTEGELGSRGNVEIRYQESAASAKILDLDFRENLKFRDGFFTNDEAHQLSIIRMLRKYRPDIVLANAPNDRHPDHGRASQLVKDACFLSGLLKIETSENGRIQNQWRPKKIFNYIQDMYLEPDFIIDITEVFEQKMNSIKAYASQFYSGETEGPQTYISSENFLQSIEYRCRLMGKRIGVKYGEGFLSTHNHIGLHDFSGIILPEFV
jgi:bacillithiol biosynthesis deacetylase BshB1